MELQLERSHDLHSKIQGALMYPAVVVTAMIGIGVLMLIVVVPELAKTFEDLGVQLPFTTRLIIGFGSFLTHLWYVALAGTLAFLLLLRFAVSTLWGKRLIDSFSLRAPLISGIVHKMNSAIIVRTLSSLIAAGVPLLQALDITSHTVKNRSFQESLEYAGEQVKKGARLSEALEPYGKLYPSLVIQMVKVGEETGQTSDILAKLASFFEEEVTNATKNLASIIEPVLMLIVGAVVGFFAISMVQPMYSILGGIK
ncbi:MAG: type II secretion system F family protein [Patescibacteria group bacterium]